MLGIELRSFLLGLQMAAFTFYGVKSLRMYLDKGGQYNMWYAMFLFFLVIMLGVEIVVDQSDIHTWVLVWMVNMLAFPMVGNVIFDMSALRLRPVWKKLSHFVPYVLFVIGVFVFPDAEKYYQIVVYLITMYIIVIGPILVLHIRRYHKQILEMYSSVQDRDLYWLYWVLGLFLCQSALWLTLGMAIPSYSDELYYICLLLIISVVTYFLNRHRISLLLTEEDAPAPEKPSEKASLYAYFEERLADFEKDRDAYTNPNFTIQNLSEYIKTNRTYMSQYLNREKGVNFYDYINGLRMVYACELLENTNDSVEQIAEKAGFSSLSIFRRYLREQFNCSPLEYRQQKKKTE